MKSFVYVLISLFLFFNIVYAQNNQNNLGNKYIEKQVTEVLTDLHKENSTPKDVDKDEEFVFKNNEIQSVDNSSKSDSSTETDIKNGDSTNKKLTKEELKAKFKEELKEELIKELLNQKEDTKTQSQTVTQENPKKEEVKTTPEETKATTPITTETEQVKPYDVVVFGVKITSLRRDTQETTAEIRAEEASYKLEQILKKGDLENIRAKIKTIKYGYSININDEKMFSILHGDAGTAIGKDKEKLKEYAIQAINNIGTVITQEKKRQDSQEFKNSIITISCQCSCWKFWCCG